jgi:Formyl transferase
VTRPRFAIMTAGDANGRRLTHVLNRLGIAYDLFTVAHAPPKRGKRTRSRYMIDLIRADLARIGWLRRFVQRRRPPFASAPAYLGFCNSPRMKAALRAAAPDYILMMGGGIIDAETIGIARRGVLNVHPGLLPWIRGVDVIRHAVLRDVPIGVTAHYIDVGIDTGDVIEQVRLTVGPGENHSTLAERADEISVAFMADLARRLWAGETLPRMSQSEKHPLCRTLGAEDAARADALIAEGVALDLAATEPFRSRFPDDSALMSFYDDVWPAADRF